MEIAVAAGIGVSFLWSRNIRGREIEMPDFEMLYELTQDDLKFFEELTGAKLEVNEDGQRLATMNESVLYDGHVFH